MTFALDANGILSVSARHGDECESAETTIKADRGRLDEDDIRRMIEDAKKMREGDSQFAEKARLRNALEEALYCGEEDGLRAKKGAARRLVGVARVRRGGRGHGRAGRAGGDAEGGLRGRG